GFDRVFEIGKSFRDEKLTSKNSPEFTTMECYQAFADYTHMLELTEILVSEVVRHFSPSLELTFRGHTVSFARPWKRITFEDALETFAGIRLKDYQNTDEIREAVRAVGLEDKLPLSRREMINCLVENVVEPRLIQPT